MEHLLDLDALLEFLRNMPGIFAYLFVFTILLLCGLGLPAPEDIWLFLGGLSAYFGQANVWVMILVCMAGVLIGDSIVFLLGVKFGPRLLRKRFFQKILPPARMEAVKSRLDRQGNVVIFFARFMPGLRTPVFFSCGMLGKPFRVFFFFDGVAALISVPAIVYATYYFGESIIGTIKNIEHGIVIGVVVVLLYVLTKYLLKKRRNQKNELAV